MDEEEVRDMLSEVSDLNGLMQAAESLHDLMKSFEVAGFTRQEALYLTSNLMLASFQGAS